MCAIHSLDAAEKDLLTAQSIADTNEDTVPLFTPHSEVDALSNTVSAATVLPAICRLLANVCLRKKDYDVARDALSVVLRFQPGDGMSVGERSTVVCCSCTSVVQSQRYFIGVCAMNEEGVSVPH